MAPTILLTRAEPAALDFADQIRKRLGCGVDVVISPLMHIAPVPDALVDPGGFASLIFTSRNAVTTFAALTTQRDWPSYCVGRATAAVARQEGFPTVSADGAAEDLARLLADDRPSTPCLYLRGDHVASDLASKLNSAGIETHEAIVYRQVEQNLSDQARALLDREFPVILPLFSPRSARIFFEQEIGSAPLLVAAMGENVADAVPANRVASVCVAKAPTAKAILDATEGLLDAAKRLESGFSAQ